MSPSHERLAEILGGLRQAAIAVSGGIDSLTLATAAHRRLPGRVVMHHATSPAVPPPATARTRELAAREGWTLEVFDAGEFDNPAYRANPANRCFYCKTSLYGAVARRAEGTILSGTNLDDLGEYRPGLQAAAEHRVRHPFVEAGIGKSTVRALAVELGLGALSELPASPCLSSRIETGLAIDPVQLAMVHDAERELAGLLRPRTVRLRVRAAALVVELDEATLASLDPEREAVARQALGRLAASAGLDVPLRFAAYRNGSAFVRPGPARSAP